MHIALFEYQRWTHPSDLTHSRITPSLSLRSQTAQAEGAQAFEGISQYQIRFVLRLDRRRRISIPFLLQKSPN